ncbi:ABC transporter ATP-binding protein [Xenorhabdus sp. 12]|uniref:ABC transporter ATP-binding protein n=1 Tax=Xenorhabdus santafensis TaxID=2582833 RepID=A0ABU4S7L9_9GAMM|nr:ABC transporter ATP-binding protein [Xenorhabdus sp. 12]MDX7986715.1 ABC transporter ATP-binding protein [Xenorhabdus sp. 12]
MKIQTNMQEMNSPNLLAGFKLLWQSARPMKKAIIGAFLALSITLACDLAGPFVIRHYIDKATAGTFVYELIFLALGYAIISCFGVIAGLVTSYWSTNAGWGIADTLRRQLFHHVVHNRSILQIESEAQGKLLEKIEGNADIIGKTIAESGFKIIGNIALVLGTLIILFSIIPEVGVAITVLVLVVAYILVKLTQLAVVRWQKAREEKAHIFGFIGDVFVAKDDLHLLGRSRWPALQLQKMLSVLLKMERKAYVSGRIFWPITQLFFALSFGLGFGFGLQLLGHNSISIGTLTMIYLYVDRLREPMEDMSSEVDQVQRLMATLSLVVKMLRDEEKVSHNSVEVQLPEDPLPIKFEQVYFRYESQGRQVLHNVSFSVDAGSKVGIVGRTGAGKSTLLNLMCGLAQPDSGRVTIADVEVTSIHPDEFAKRVAVLSQKAHLFSSTLRENLTLFDSNISDNAIWCVLEELNIHRWVKALPEGLDTLMGNGGRSLSEGEVQMIAGARTMLQDAQLIIIDEGTSLLDPNTEKSWLGLLEKISANRTVIIVAHRLHTLSTADQVIIMSEGCVKEIVHGEGIKTLTENMEFIS